MPVATLSMQATKVAIKQAVRAIPQGVAAGGILSEKVLERCGNILLAHIRREFIIKSKGGTDQAGYKWAPLKPSTVAYRKSNRTLAERYRRNRPSQGLTRSQQDRWWELYRQGLAIYKGNKASAAKRAWTILKASGVKTLFSRYANSQVRILYDSGKLYNSIGVRVGRGEVSIGSTHKAAVAHHYGVRGKLPQRRLWPPPEHWPASWWRDILREVEVGVRDAVIAAMQGIG